MIHQIAQLTVIQGEIKRLREENAALVAEKDKFKRLAVILHNLTEEYKNNVVFVCILNNFQSQRTVRSSLNGKKWPPL